MVNLARWRWRQKKLPKARKRYHETLETFRRMGEAQMEATSWHQLGRVAEEGREWDEAERCYKEALSIREQIRDLPELAKTCNQLAIVAKGAGRLDEAERWYVRAIELFEEVGDKLSPSICYNNLASLLLAQNRLDEASVTPTRREIMGRSIFQRSRGRLLTSLPKLLRRGKEMKARSGGEGARDVCGVPGNSQVVEQFSGLH